jgi:hypothetical protein
MFLKEEKRRGIFPILLNSNRSNTLQRAGASEWQNANTFSTSPAHRKRKYFLSPGTGGSRFIEDSHAAHAVFKILFIRVHEPI